MPGKNTVKTYGPMQTWHIYNRGVDKRLIFVDPQDYSVFLAYLKACLLPEIDEDFRKECIDILKIERMRSHNIHEEVELLAYCLMPNHIHLELFQKTAEGIAKLMRSVMTGYVMYFNNKYKRQGRLFQGTYKAVEVKTVPYWLHLSRYIHLNPVDLVADYKYYDNSSFKYYSGTEKIPSWLKTTTILSEFKSAKDYEIYCDGYIRRRTELKEIEKQLADS
jgi:putative transposase